MGILQVLINPVLPVFAILALGFFLGKTNRMTVEQAKTVNWVATSIFLPILVLGLVSNVPFKQFSPEPLLSYMLAELIIISLAFWLALKLGLQKQEAVLMSVGCVFVNNVFLVLPISQFLYGAENVLPIVAILTLDTIILFMGTLFALELTRPEQPSLRHVFRVITRLPLVQAIGAGLLLNLLNIKLADPIQTFISFNGHAAAPLALVALGIVLSQVPIRFDRVVCIFTGIKLIIFPFTVWAAMSLFAPVTPDSGKYMLSSAGPITTAVFSFGMLYGAPTTRVAQLLVLTTLLSLISIAALA
ncbi:AEC family transporter [uncultured Amphritea sp.]|uniref:AEC family transporter n=1 Tax=uncultured Amphritea sp. TaxID=981605 RepID=UPI00262C9168|nr:AEC family transporter [uncultured Amphritea sp.]